MKTLRAALLSTLLSISALPAVCQSAQRDADLADAIEAYMPGTTGFGDVKVKKVTINDKKRTITVVYNDAASYIPLTLSEHADLKAEVLRIFGPKYRSYKVSLVSDGKDLSGLVTYGNKKNVGPTEKEPFIVRLDAPAAPAGLDGANIALWQSHGWYFEPKLNRWEWQRARVMQTVEDLYTQSYVMPFLMPMLENAGANVMSPRERDTNLTEIIADNDHGKYAGGHFATTGHWSKTRTPAFAYTSAELHDNQNPFREGSSLKTALSGTDEADATASWQARIPRSADYAVYVSYTTEPNSTSAAHYTVYAADGEHHFTVNQRMGAGTWIYLGHFPLKASDEYTTVVELSNAGSDRSRCVTADAVKIGGGMGNVARIVKEPLDDIDYEYVLSGYPRFTEGARYFLQWAGAPDSVYTPSDNVNDYGDDYKSRGLWVNWLAGGSSMLPKREGLNIPVDLSFAFHTDAGCTPNDSIVGTLGIYCTAGDRLGNGSDRMASRDFNNEVMTNIVEDVRALYEPNWTRRGMWDKSYFEARVPEVPSMLLELLSHQNFADMAYGLDPTFRFTVSRAIYKGMLKFLAHRDGRSYTVQPLPVRAFAITATNADTYRLTWSETVDSLESTASPTYYIVEERVDDGAFRAVATTKLPEYTVTPSDNRIYSYRIIAGNDGGTAFPSEILALCHMPGRKPVTIVNGFTRVSGPDRFDAGDIAGFYDAHDHGVPYLRDISFIGSQFEFRRDIPWMDDDAAGFGASRADYEDKVIAGNTFDFVYTHGTAIRDCGYGFVSSSLEAFCAATDTPATVDLILGKQKETKVGTGLYGNRYKAFPASLQARLRALAAAGSNIFASGAYIASDIWDNPYSDKETAEADKRFAREVLGFNWRVDQASVTGEAYQVATRFKDFGKGDYTFQNKLDEDLYVVESPDSFYPADDDKAATFMRYTENNLIAGTVLMDSHRAVAIGFPFETIHGADSRKHLMKQILDFFADPRPLRNIHPRNKKNK